MNRLSATMLLSTSRTLPRLVFTSVSSSSSISPVFSAVSSIRCFAAAAKPNAASSVVSTLDAPAAIGPYSQARKAGGMVFVSGSLGLDPKSGKFPSDTDVAVQAKQSMDNIVAILKSANSSIDHVVKTTILLADINDFAKVNEIYAKYFTSGIYPARATYAVKSLPKGALVEIEAIATHN